MITRTRNLVGALVLSSVVLLSPTAAPTSAATMPIAPVASVDAQQAGLVNVTVTDITVGDVLSENNVSVAAAANVVAQVCPNVNVGQIGVLAAQALAQGTTQTTTCQATGDTIAIAPSTSNPPRGRR
jgi:hypothetical protein